MSSTIFSEADLLNFTASEPFYFGYRIAITELEEKDGEWRADVFVVPPGKDVEIYFSSNGIKGQSLIVLRSWPGENERYSHEAVLLDLFKQAVQEIENEIIELLRPAREP